MVADRLPSSELRKHYYRVRQGATLARALPFRSGQTLKIRSSPWEAGAHGALGSQPKGSAFFLVALTLGIPSVGQTSAHPRERMGFLASWQSQAAGNGPSSSSGRSRLISRRSQPWTGTETGRGAKLSRGQAGNPSAQTVGALVPMLLKG